MRRPLLILAVLVMTAAACGSDAGEGALVGTATTTTSAPAATSTSTTQAPPRTPTTPATTLRRTPAEEVVESGTSPAGPWQLVAGPGGRSGLVCAALKVQQRDAGSVCNEASEQDSNGNDTLRYSGTSAGSFVIGVALPTVARVRAELRGGTVVERATVAASFTTAARFVTLPLPADSVIRSLTALDASGGVLTRISINP